MTRPAAAQAITDDLEGTLGSLLVAAHLGLQGRELSGVLSFGVTGDQLNLAGELFTQPLSDGLTSCEFVPDWSSKQRRHGRGQLRGICEVGVLDGAATLSFEGFWRTPGRSDEPVVLTSRRTLAARLWRRYGALLPAPAAAVGNPPPAGCASTPAIDAVARDVANVAYILHSRHFRCVVPPYGIEWSSYSAALSVVDESAATPVLVGTTPIAHSVDDASDVVDWAATLSGFWLTPGMLGLLVTAGGTISGSGVITTATDHIFAVAGRAAPRLLLSVAGNSFGKSGMGNAASDDVSVYTNKPESGALPLVLVTTDSWAMVDGVDQARPPKSSVYRFDAKRLALVAVPSGHTTSTALIDVGPASPRMLSDIAPSRPTSLRR